VNGIDGFLGKPSIVLDARVMSPGAKPGNSAGTQADSERAAAFGGHLADLSRQGGNAGDKADLASTPNRTVPALIQQSFLLAAGTAEAARYGASEPETVMPDTRSTIANPRASSKAPDGTNFAERLVIASGGAPAMAPNPAAAGASPGVRVDTHAERALAPGEDASFADGESRPAGQRPVSNPSRDSHARPVASAADTFVTSPFAPGLPLPYAFMAANQEKGDGSDGMATFPDAALAGVARDSEAMREMVSLGAPPAFPKASRAAGQPPLTPALASREKPVAPRGSTGMESLLTGVQSGASAATPTARVFVPAAGDAHDLASSLGPTPLVGESALDSAAAQEMGNTHASHSADPNGSPGLDFATSAPVGVLVVNQQTHFAPPTGLSPAQQMAHPVLGSAPARAAGDAHGLAPSIGPVPSTEESALESTDANEIVKPHATVVTDKNYDHGLDFADSAPVKGLVVNQHSQLVPSIGMSPAQQIAELVAAGAGPGDLDASAITTQSSRALNAAGAADSNLSMSRVQTMTLQLDPESLGKVTVSMRLSGTRLDLRVETERPETMQLIGKEKDLLAGKLQAAGFVIAALVIQPAEPQAPHQHFGVNVPSTGQDPFTGQANGGPSAHDRPSNHDDGQRSRPGLADDAQNGSGFRRSGGDLYI
jgi:chemotaxis protein MotD